MTFRCNKWHGTSVSMWNESDAIVEDSGRVYRTSGSEVLINILLLRTGTMLFYDGNGRFVEEGVLFQVSKKELDDASFTIKSGKTYLRINGETYRVMNVLDYTGSRQTLLMQCKAVKILNAD